MRGRDTGLALVLGIVLAFAFGAAWIGSFEAIPAGSDAPSTLDNVIRDLKTETRRRAEVESNFGSGFAGGANDSGIMREGSARAFFTTANPTVIAGPGYYDSSAGTNPSALLTTNIGGDVIGDGRLFVDSDGGAARAINTLFAYDGSSTTWERVVADANETALGGKRNLLRNGSFEDTVDTASAAGTAAPLGWSKTLTPDLGLTDTPVSEGVGHQLEVTSTGSGNEGVNQAFTTGLKASTNYRASVRALSVGGSTCQLSTSGAGANITSSCTTGSCSAAYATLTGTFATDAVPAAKTLFLLSTTTTGSCNFDHAAVWEEAFPQFNVASPGRVTQFGQFTTDDTAVPTNYADAPNPLVTLSVTVPGPGYVIRVQADSCVDFTATQVGNGSSYNFRITETKDADPPAMVRETSAEETGSPGGGAAVGIGADAVSLVYVNTAPTPGSSYTYKIEGKDGGAADVVWNSTTIACHSSALAVELIPQG